MDKLNTQVIELCPHCDFEVTLEWDIDKHGHSIYCPNCGERIMLCSECPERDGAFHCDWSESNPKTKVCLWDNYVEKVQKRKDGEADMNKAFIGAIASKTIFNSINNRRSSPVQQGEGVKRYDVYLHIETVHGQFNDIYTVNAHNEKEVVSLAVTRFRNENDCSGVTLIQALSAESVVN